MTLANMHRIIFVLFALSSLVLTACSIHKIDIQQGNVITQEMLETLTVGMDKRRVKLAIGSPMVQDPFHPNRWDYVYSYRAGMSDEAQSSHVVLLFEGDILKTIDVRKAPPLADDVLMPTLQSRGY